MQAHVGNSLFLVEILSTRAVYVNLVIFSLHKYAGAFAFAKFQHQEYSVFILTTINLLC